MNGLSHARPSLRSGLSWDRPDAGSNLNVKHTGQFTCYEDRTFSLAIDNLGGGKYGDGVLGGVEVHVNDSHGCLLAS